jgi:hypothetical protein
MDTKWYWWRFEGTREDFASITARWTTPVNVLPFSLS